MKSDNAASPSAGGNVSRLVDGYGRTINYLRLSITDRCNLRCFYCGTCENFQYIPHANILTYEECLSLIRLSHSLQVSKVRLTGGEPFVRKDFTRFLARVMQELPGLDLRVTTNGTLLQGRGGELKETGLRCLNISLDTLDREKYRRLTGRDYFPRVRKAIDDCLEAGIRVKINAVAMRGVNDSEIDDFVDFALNNPVDLRFIEFMPVGESSAWNRDLYWSTTDILAAVRDRAELVPAESDSQTCGPAQMYELPSGWGRIGVISPLSEHFCARCNRFRITSDGKLRTCLFSDKEYNLRALLRSPRLGMDKVLKVMLTANARKPMGYKLLEDCGDSSVCQRRMSAIGG
jgi:cyclic pyranopterin phosphate synthase